MLRMRGDFYCYSHIFLWTMIWEIKHFWYRVFEIFRLWTSDTGDHKAHRILDIYIEPSPIKAHQNLFVHVKQHGPNNKTKIWIIFLKSIYIFIMFYNFSWKAFIKWIRQAWFHRFGFGRCSPNTRFYIVCWYIYNDYFHCWFSEGFPSWTIYFVLNLSPGFILNGPFRMAHKVLLLYFPGKSFL